MTYIYILTLLINDDCDVGCNVNSLELTFICYSQWVLIFFLLKIVFKKRLGKIFHIQGGHSSLLTRANNCCMWFWPNLNLEGLCGPVIKWFIAFSFRAMVHRIWGKECTGFCLFDSWKSEIHIHVLTTWKIYKTNSKPERNWWRIVGHVLY